MLRTSDFGPHVVPHGLLDTTILSQRTGITQFISGQPLSRPGGWLLRGAGTADLLIWRIERHVFSAERLIASLFTIGYVANLLGEE